MPAFSEAEAFNRLIGMAALIDQPIMIFHVSTAEGAKVIRDARGQGLKVFAETCPQYLFLTADDLDKPGVEGAKWMCSPPPRTRRRPGGAVAGAGARRSPDHLVRSRAVSFRRDRQAARRPQSELQAGRQRPAGTGAAAAAAVRRDGVEGAAGPGKVRRADRDGAGQDLQSASAQGLDRDRRRCRYRDLGSRARGHDRRTR